MQESGNAVLVQTWWNPDYNRPPLGKPVARAPRITRDEAAIEALESDLLAFAKLVKEYEAKLKARAAANLPQFADLVAKVAA